MFKLDRLTFSNLLKIYNKLIRGLFAGQYKIDIE